MLQYKEQIKSLNLVDENLINNSLPDSIRYLSNLEWLSIHGKLLKKLPESIVELKQLDTLHIFGSFHRIQENYFRFSLGRIGFFLIFTSSKLADGNEVDFT